MLAAPDQRPFRVGELQHEDVASALLEYDSLTISLDFTAWEPTPYCVDWAIDIYGTNGALHALLSPPHATVVLREPADGLSVGLTDFSAHLAAVNADPFAMQLDSFLARARNQPANDSCTAGTGEDVMAVLEAMYASANTRAWVPCKPALPG